MLSFWTSLRISTALARTYAWTKSGVPIGTPTRIARNLFLICSVYPLTCNLRFVYFSPSCMSSVVLAYLSSSSFLNKVSFFLSLTLSLCVIADQVPDWCKESKELNNRRSTSAWDLTRESCGCFPSPLPPSLPSCLDVGRFCTEFLETIEEGEVFITDF